MSDRDFKWGDIVEKTSGDYRFKGVIVARFRKLSGATRYVVENPDGILHIFSGANLGPWKLVDVPAAHANIESP